MFFVCAVVDPSGAKSESAEDEGGRSVCAAVAPPPEPPSVHPPVAALDRLSNFDNAASIVERSTKKLPAAVDDEPDEDDATGERADND
jgi:hypothetical protein